MAAAGEVFSTPIENFYMTDPISRSSQTMAKCTGAAPALLCIALLNHHADLTDTLCWAVAVRVVCVRVVCVCVCVIGCSHSQLPIPHLSQRGHLAQSASHSAQPKRFLYVNVLAA